MERENTGSSLRTYLFLLCRLYSIVAYFSCLHSRFISGTTVSTRSDFFFLFFSDVEIKCMPKAFVTRTEPKMNPKRLCSLFPLGIRITCRLKGKVKILNCCLVPFKGFFSVLKMSQAQSKTVFFYI